MKREAARAWRLANKYADCQCQSTGVVRGFGADAIGKWSAQWEYWNNTPTSGRFITASLVLDGMDASELP